MVEQLSVFLQNQAGKIAAITQVLAEGGVDIRALSIADTTDFGVLRMLVSDIGRAKALLEQQYMVSATEVTVIAVPDAPGGLARIMGLMAQANLDIEYMYSLIGREDDRAFIVFRVSEDVRLNALLQEEGIEMADRMELGLQ